MTQKRKKEGEIYPQFEILSWKKNRNECGTRLNLIDHNQIFAYEYGIEFKVDESQSTLLVRVKKFSDKFDYTQEERVKIGEDKARAEECVIIGTKEQIKKFQYFSGYNTEKRRANNDMSVLCDCIEDLAREVTNLKYEVEKLHKQLNNGR